MSAEANQANVRAPHPPKKFGRMGPLMDKHIGTFCNGNYKNPLKSPIKALYCRLKIILVCAGDHWLCRGYLQPDNVGVVELVIQVLIVLFFMFYVHVCVYANSTLETFQKVQISYIFCRYQIIYITMVMDGDQEGALGIALPWALMDSGPLCQTDKTGENTPTQS